MSASSLVRVRVDEKMTLLGLRLVWYTLTVHLTEVSADRSGDRTGSQAMEMSYVSPGTTLSVCEKLAVR